MNKYKLHISVENSKGEIITRKCIELTEHSGLGRVLVSSLIDQMRDKLVFLIRAFGVDAKEIPDDGK